MPPAMIPLLPMLMSVAEILSALISNLKGIVKFIFQPVDQGVPEGKPDSADFTHKERVMDNTKVDVVF